MATWEEAISHMENGKPVRHDSWGFQRYIEMKDSKIYDQDGEDFQVTPSMPKSNRWRLMNNSVDVESLDDDGLYHYTKELIQTRYEMKQNNLTYRMRKWAREDSGIPEIDTVKFYIVYGGVLDGSHRWFIDKDYQLFHLNTVYFNTEESARKAIKVFGDEIIEATYFYKIYHGISSCRHLYSRKELLELIKNYK